MMSSPKAIIMVCELRSDKDSKIDMNTPRIGEDDPLNLGRSKALTEYYKYKIQRATYNEIEKKIVPIAHVHAYIGRLANIVRIGLSQLPDRLAPRLSKETDEETCHSLIMEEMRDISSQLEHALDESQLKRHLEESDNRKKSLIQHGKVSSWHK